MSDTGDKKQYEPPELTVFGSVESVTEQSNKEGLSTDQYTDDTNLVGSITSA